MRKRELPFVAVAVGAAIVLLLVDPHAHLTGPSGAALDQERARPAPAPDLPATPGRITVVAPLLSDGTTVRRTVTIPIAIPGVGLPRLIDDRLPPTAVDGITP